MNIKVLGTGCMKCDKLYTEAKMAIAESGVPVKLEKVEKIDEIADYGVMMTPALVIDEKVVSSGKVISAKEITRLIIANEK